MTIDRNLLSKIADATANNVDYFVSKAEGLPLIQHTPTLITVDIAKTDPNDASKVAARITPDGVAILNTETVVKTSTVFSVSTGIVLPKVKRGGGGGGGAPTKYPFDTMNVGEFFFVADSTTKTGDAVKTISSAVGAANQRYAEPTGETETVTRAKRDKKNKAILDDAGNKVLETVELAKKKATRKFVVRRVEANVKYGDFTAPADGAVVARTI